MTSQSARHDEWENITGASLTSIAWRIVSSDTWAEIHEHAGRFELADHILAECGEPSVRVLARGRIRPGRVVVVR